MEKIQAYAIIGNGKSAALVSRRGSIDWLCWPRFDSPSLFAKILDQDNGGSWTISAVLQTSVKRHYIEDTNVLQTEFTSEKGRFVITDCMTAFSENEKMQSLQPAQELIRRIHCEEGEADIQILFNPRLNYGKNGTTIKEGKSLGLRMEWGRHLICLHSEVHFQILKKGAFAEIHLKAGQIVDFSLTCTSEGPAVIPSMHKSLISKKISMTINWWQEWSRKTTYEGPYKKEVIRSALVLKLLGYAPSGTFIAALTTSLPQRVGGEFNWDYRFCWLRDAAFTVRALFGLGYKEEAEAFVSWLLHSTRLSFPALKVLYDVYGEDISDDVVLPHLNGYKGSKPVRVGNGVRRFFELDIYGEVIEAVTYLVRAGASLDHQTQKLLMGFGKYVCKNWQRPDTGIWEKMEPLKHYTHSKLMCWVALDRLIELQNRGKLKNIHLDLFKEHRQLIRKAIEEKGWNDDIKSYTQTLDGRDLDSAVLVMLLYKFLEPTSEKMQETLQKIQDNLSPAPGLMYRYEKSTEEGEGAFGLSCFWNAECIARGGGTLQKAHQTFKQILAYANDLGLFSEEIEPISGDLIGNFPQAFTHVGLINTALSLMEREKGIL